MRQVVCYGSRQGLNYSLVHDPGDQPKGPASQVLVVADEVIAEGVAGQEDLFLEGLVSGGFGLFDDLPVEEHDFSELIGFVLLGDDVGYDVHDGGGVCLVVGHGLDQFLDCLRPFFEGARGHFVFEFFEVGRSVGRPDEEGAHAHGNINFEGVT